MHGGGASEKEAPRSSSGIGDARGKTGGLHGEARDVWVQGIGDWWRFGHELLRAELDGNGGVLSLALAANED